MNRVINHTPAYHSQSGLPHILLVVRWPVGGIRTHIKYILSALGPSQFRYTVVAPEIEEYSELSNDLKALKAKFITVLNGNKFSAGRFIRAIIKALIFQQIDLVHCHGLTAGACALLPAKVTRTPIVVTLHDMFLSTQFCGALGSLKRAFISLVLPRFNFIHLVGEDAKRNLLSQFQFMKNHNHKLIVIKNGIEIQSLMVNKKRDFRNELNLPEDSFLIGFLGRFMSPKGFTYLVEAIRRLASEPSIQKMPIVLCFGSGGFIREEQKRISALGLGHHFVFMPFTDKVADAIAGLDVVIMPSVWETCPLLPMEVMMIGTPFIGSDCMGLREVLDNTPARVVHSRSALAIAEAIKEEIAHPSVDVAKQFSQQAAARFDIRTSAAALDALYKRAIQM